MSLCMIEAIVCLVIGYLWTRYVAIRPRDLEIKVCRYLSGNDL